MRITIIGAGLLGVSTAYFLRHHGVEATVIDREQNAALGASYGNGGYLQSTAPDPWNAPGVFRLFVSAWMNSVSGKGDRSAFAARTLALPGLLGWGIRFMRNANPTTFRENLVHNMHLAQYTQAVLREINDRESLQYDWKEGGAFIIFRDEPSMAGYVEAIDPVRVEGARFEAIDRDRLLKEEPAFSEIADELTGAVFFPDDVGANARTFCRELARISANAGVRFIYDNPVHRVRRQGRGFVIGTRNGDFLADAVVIATGAHSPKLTRSLGIQLPVAPAKGYSVSIPMAGWQTPLTRVIADMGVHAGVNPMGGVLRIAGTAEFTGLRPGITPERTKYLIGLAKQLFPSFARNVDPSDIDPWGGHRPLSADGIPIIGASGIDNLFLNTGHGGLGWTQAAGSGKALADRIVGEKPEIDLSPFSLTRFD